MTLQPWLTSYYCGYATHFLKFNKGNILYSNIQKHVGDSINNKNLNKIIQL